MISIITPVHNVEDYLKKCLDSLADQTLDDVEFIIIDDGSTDNSSTIADTYTDSRFHIYHTDNQGLSAARNYGLDHSCGEWIMFVDGDDWVVPEFSQKAVATAIETDADLVIFQTCFIDKNKHKRIEPILRDFKTKIVDAETAMDFGGDAAWNKLYKRNLFDSIRYPEGKVYEDLAITHRIVYAAKKIAMMAEVLYYHTYRTNSITNIYSISNLKDSIIFAKKRYDDLISYGYPIQKAEKNLVFYVIRFLVRAEPSKSYEYRVAEHIADSINAMHAGLSIKQSIMWWIWKRNKHLFHFLCRIVGRRYEEDN